MRSILCGFLKFSNSQLFILRKCYYIPLLNFDKTGLKVTVVKIDAVDDSLGVMNDNDWITSSKLYHTVEIVIFQLGKQGLRRLTS